MAVKKIILQLIVGFYIANSVSAQVRSYPANSLQETYMMLSNIHGINTERFYPQEYKSLKASWGFDTVVRNVDYVELTLLPPIRNTKPHQYFTYAHPNFSLMPQYTPRFLRFLKPLGKNSILKTPAWFFSWMDNSSNKGSFFVVNPILHTEFSPKSPYTSRFLNNTKGIELFGQFSKNLSFSTQLVESQFYFQKYITQYQDTFNVTPNVGYWNKNLYGYSDFFRARANIYANIVNSASSKTHVVLSAGHDNQHIGNGYRSLLISNFSPATAYLKLNTRLGPFRYQNLYQELSATDKPSGSRLLPKKYMAMHRASLEFAKPNWLIKKESEKLGNWIELGLSEMILQTRPNGGLDMNYWNPIIFYRSIERDLGSPDNVLIMFDGKIRQKNAMFYAQFLLDEFSFGDLIQGNTWRNKHGYQIGTYIKPNINSIYPKFGSIVFQAEINSVRPFTYSHSSMDANAVNYNQALAHPLESNFRELNFSVRFKPEFIRGFLFTHNTFYAVRGFDYSTTGENFGSDIRRDYRTRVSGDNVNILQGEVGNIMHSKTQLFYELMPNMWVYLAAQFRTQTGHQPSREYYTYLGLRWNWYEEQQLF